MNEVVFVDTNVLIYAHDAAAGHKRDVAIERLQRLWDEDAGRLSVQVLQEFYVNVTRKLSTRVAHSIAREVVDTYAAWVREATTPSTVIRAIDIAEIARLSFWDAMILASAEQAGATKLLTEDLNPGQAIVGVKIINPFVPASA